MRKRNQGYTLLELMITVAIIAIIAAIAIPSYMGYTKKSYYSELVRATAPYKLGVIQCYNETGTFVGCTSGANVTKSIPPSITAPPNPNSAIGSIAVTDGVITATPNTIGGLTTAQVYTLTPQAANGMISWMPSGQGVVDGLAK
jgi:prepilin-type N-terminal cleavage/methylation domain-containing protein